MDLERDLNEPQREAVLHRGGPLLVLAGAGSGKTRVITYRIATLIEEGTPARRLLALTFTNKAATEMRERAESLVGGDAGGMWIGTFHAICARLLRRHGDGVGISPRFVVYDKDDQLTLIKRVTRDLGLPERMFAPRDLLSQIDRAKNRGVTAQRYEPDDFLSDVVAKVYPAYERRLAAADAVDFGNLLLKTLLLLREQRELADELAQHFAHVLVDEFQDTNLVQYELTRLLSRAHGNICVVGDDDQSIYSWRGADIRNILGFERDHPDAKVVKLEQNYRSTQTILDAAGAVISRNADRKPKQLWTAAGAGAKISCHSFLDEREEARLVVDRIRAERRGGRSLGDFAVFYRTHAQSRAIEEAMRGAVPPVPHVVVGGVRFYERAEVKDLIAYLRLLANDADEISLRRIINVPPRGIGAQTLEKVSAHATANQLSLAQAVRRCAGSSLHLLGAGPRRKLTAFCELIDELRSVAAASSLAAVADAVLQRSGYLERLSVDDSIEAETRRENLMELIGSIRAFEEAVPTATLTDFLEHIALSAQVDDYAAEEGTVTLMTVHSAKGLEFPVVFIVGLEQGVFPHSRSLDDAVRMEEERRLAYVAITRARERLFISHAERRWAYGQQQAHPPSQFIADIPRQLIEHHGQHDDDRQRVGAARRDTPRQRRQTSPRRRGADEVWVDHSYDQSQEAGAGAFRVGMKVRHKKFGVGEIRVITGAPPALNLTVYFKSVGPRTIRSDFVTAV